VAHQIPGRLISMRSTSATELKGADRRARRSSPLFRFSRQNASQLAIGGRLRIGIHHLSGARQGHPDAVGLQLGVECSVKPLSPALLLW